MAKIKSVLTALAFAPVAVLAEGEPSYTVPAGVTTAINDAKAAAEGLVNAALPGYAYIAITGVVFAVVWFLAKGVRRLFR